MSVRVRFAPSPTGQLHVGNVRVALFNWLFARHGGGTFVLRIEDTDIEREQEGAEETIYADLAWLGLDWDEGPVPSGERAERAARGSGEGCAASGGQAERAARARGDGPAPAREQGEAAGLVRARPEIQPAGYGPYRQSERGPWYERALDLLREKDAAYPCFCADSLLEEERREALAKGRTPGYSGRCARLDPAAAAARMAAGEPCALRFRVRAYGIVPDLLRGSVDFRSREVFDPVLRRRDGRPTYNFAVVVDDAAMKISHVLRGEDHLTNTALQLRLYEELALAAPLFVHLPLILGPDGTPLSKRHGATSVGEMRARGYPPEALVAALALLGWTPPGDKVILERQEMVALFGLEDVNATAAVFDFAKLDWISGQIIRTMNRKERGRRLGERLCAAGLLSSVARGRSDDAHAPGIQPPEPPDGAAQTAGAPRAGKGPAPDPGGSVRSCARSAPGAAAPPGAEEWLMGLGDLLATSLVRFEQAPALAAFIFRFEVSSALAAGALEGESARGALETFARLFAEAGPLREGEFAGLVERAKRETGLKGRALLHPLRAAVTGETSGPELARAVPLIDEAARLGLAPGLVSPAQRIHLVLDHEEDAGRSPDHSRQRET